MPVPINPVKAAQAALGIGTGVYKMFAGGKQIRDGEKLNRENVFQNYYRPSESLQALQLSKNAYNNQGVAGQQIIENKINSGAATGLDNISRNTSSSGDLLDSAIKLEANKNQQIANVGLAGAQQQERDVANLQGQLGVQSGYADKEFQYNVTNPYERKAAAASALIQAGNQNKFGGLDNIAGVATSALDSMSGGGETRGDQPGAIQPIDTNSITQFNRGNQLGNNFQPIAATSIQAPTSVTPSQGYDPSGFAGTQMVFDPKTKRMTFKR